MNAVVVREKSMAEDRIARLESAVSELKGDVKAVNTRISESITTTAKEFGALRTEMEQGFGRLGTDMEKGLGTLRTDMEKGLGTLRTDMEKGLGTLRSDTEKGLGTLRSEMEKGFGTLRAETEKTVGSLKASIESAKLWMLVTGVGSVILVTFVSFLGRALKLF